MSKRILIVDDAAFMREMLRDLLTEEGFEIAAEIDDAERMALFDAIDSLEDRYDVLLVDTGAADNWAEAH